MKTKRCCDEEDRPLLPEVYLIQKVLVWLPVVSLLRFKSVCKSWRALIQASSFIDLHTTAITSSSSFSSNKFGSFILHAALDLQERSSRENALLMLSSLSVSERVSIYESWCSAAAGFNGICCRCDSSGSGGICGRCDSSGSGVWWVTNGGLCANCGKSNAYRGVAGDDDDDHQLCKMDNNFLGGGGVSNDDDQLVLKLDNLGFPSCYQFDKIRPIDVVGSHNGLICLHDSDLGDVSLWNPATRQFRILPKSITITTIDGNDDCLHRFCAFGFDAETKDYKVVLLSGLRPRIIDDDGLMECLCRVQVYSLSTDSWRLLEGITSLPGYPFFCYPNEVLYLNGSCFFMAKFLYSSSEEQCIPPPPPPEDNDRFIISLDLTKEIITPIQLPHHHLDQELYLSYLGKKIALFKATIYTNVYESTTGCRDGVREFFDIWVLNAHCSSNVNNESWTMLTSFQIKHSLPSEWNIPRGISDDGVFALLETISGLGLGNKKMKLYNLDTKKVKNNFISCDQVMSKAFAYKPSLVSIIGGRNGCRSRYAEMDCKGALLKWSGKARGLEIAAAVG